MKILPLFSTFLILVTNKAVCSAISEIPQAEVNALFLDSYLWNYVGGEIDTKIRPDWAEECYRMFHSPNQNQLTSNDCIFILNTPYIVKCKPPNQKSRIKKTFLVSCECKKRPYHSEHYNKVNPKDIFYIAPMKHGTFHLINNPMDGGTTKVITEYRPYPLE